MSDGLFDTQRYETATACDNLRKAEYEAALPTLFDGDESPMTTGPVEKDGWTYIDGLPVCERCHQELDCACGICWECHSKGVPGA